MNIVVLKGNLTRDPEVRSVNANGRDTQVANFTIAVNRHYKKADGNRDKEVAYVDCEAWDAGAEILQKYCSKGDPILVNGSLKLDTWESDGQKRSKLKVRVNNFEKLNRAPDGSFDDSSSSSDSSDVADDSPAGDDIPF